ncbi:MAG: FAD-dependent oxidoreductase [Pseudomonadota bacterium]
MEIPGFTLDISMLGQQAKRPDPGETYDLLILGGGPAAMSAAVYAVRKMMKTAVLAKDIGGQVGETSQIENYLGFQTITGTDLVAKFKEHAKAFDIPIELGEKVTKIRKDGDLFKVRLEGGGEFTGKSGVLSTGTRHRPLGVPGEKELMGKGVAICSICDAPFFKDKKVVVAGGGNSAFTAALDVLKVAEKVTIINYSKGWKADEIMIESVKKFGDKLLMLDGHAVLSIDGSGQVEAVRVRDRDTNEEKVLPADGIFIEIGLLPNSDPVRDLALLNKHGELIVDYKCATSVEGLFGAGDVTTVPYKQIVVSAGEGAKAALAAYDYLVAHGRL